MTKHFTTAFARGLATAIAAPTKSWDGSGIARPCSRSVACCLPARRGIRYRRRSSLWC